MNKIKFTIEVEKEIDGYIKPEELGELETAMSAKLTEWAQNFDLAVSKKALKSNKTKPAKIRIHSFEMRDKDHVGSIQSVIERKQP